MKQSYPMTTHDGPQAGDGISNGYRRLRHKPSARLASSIVLSAVVAFLIGLSVGYSVSNIPLTKLPEPPSMSQCVADTSSLSGVKNLPTPEDLREMRDHCYSLIQSEGILGDFVLRKLNFFQQYRANGVLMWMVVGVTLSGVLLAGFQLRASYQLAMAAKTPLSTADSELVLKRDQIALRSSITGLLILLVSFGFFLVFVLYVYRLEMPEDHGASVSPAMPTLPMGRLGPPPLSGDKTNSR